MDLKIQSLIILLIIFIKILLIPVLARLKMSLLTLNK